jgi:hypothetical protein
MTLAASVAARLMVKRVSGAALRGEGAVVVTPQAPGHSACWRASGPTQAGRIIGPAAAGVLTVIILGRAAAAISRRHAE